MTKTIPFLSILTVLLTTPLFAQQHTDADDKSTTDAVQSIENYLVRARPINLVDTNGTPFENENFVIGSLLSKNKVLIPNVALRYNAFQDEFQYKTSLAEADSRIQAVRKSPDIMIQMGDDLYTFVVPGNEGGGYYQVLAEGKEITLYKKVAKKFIEGFQSVNQKSGNHPSRLIDDEGYYIITDMDKFEELPNNKKKRLNTITDDNKKEVSNYVKTNKLNLKKEEDLIQAVEFINNSV